MDIYSPVVTDAFRLLHNNLYEHLDEAEFVATAATWSEEETRRLIIDLVTVVRAIVVLHEKAESNSCRTCGAQWPCQAFQAVHRLLKDPNREFARIRERAASS
jgi:hypothetical protein